MNICWSPEAAADFAGIVDYIRVIQALSKSTVPLWAGYPKYLYPLDRNY